MKRLLNYNPFKIFIYVFFFFLIQYKQSLHIRHYNIKDKDIHSAPLHNHKIDYENITIKENIKDRNSFIYKKLASPISGKIPKNIKKKTLSFSKTLPKVLENLDLQSKWAKSKESSWVSAGPANIGGRTRALAIDINNEQILMAGGVSGGMWRSENGGGSWAKTTENEQLHSVTCIAQDIRQGRSNVWYYGTGELIGNSANAGGGSYYGHGIFKSTDNGESWEKLTSTSNNNAPHIFDNMFDFVWNIGIDASNPHQDELYAATYGGIKKSTDGGQSWENAIGGPNNAAGLFTDVAISSEGVTYATLSNSFGLNSEANGIFRSTDGDNWVDIKPVGFPIDFDRVVIGISPSQENTVYFYASTSFGPELWKYTYLNGDGSGIGGQWQDLSNNLPRFGGITGNLNTQYSYNMIIKVHPDESNIVYIGGTNLYRSADGFASPNNTQHIGGYENHNSTAGYENHHPDQHAIVFYPSNPDRMLSGHDGGISLTTDNQRNPVIWESLNNGFITTQFYAVAIEPNPRSNLIIGGLQDNGTFGNGNFLTSQSWGEIFNGDGGFCEITQNSVFVSAQNGIILRIAYDNNGNRTGIARMDPRAADRDNFLFTTPFCLDPNDQYIMYLPEGRNLWRNSRLADIPVGEDVNQTSNINWSIVAELPFQDIGVITAIAASKSPADIAYFGTSSGKVYRLSNVNTNNPDLEEVSGNNFPQAGRAEPYVSSIFINPNDAQKVSVTFSNYEVKSIFHTTNGGVSWTDVSGNLEENSNGSGNGPSVNWITGLTLSDTPVYFVGTSTGLYSTSFLNGSNTIWAQEGATSIGNVVVDMVKIREADARVVIATHGNGVYTAQYEGFSSLTGQLFSFNSIYPNPASHQVKFAFTLLKEAKVNLEIWDAQGKKVEHVINNEILTSGDKVINWTLNKSYQNGVYFCLLSVNDEKEAKRLLVIN